MTDTTALLLTPKQAAASLAISERSLWSLAKAGEIPAVKIGRSVRYAPADLLKFIESRAKGGAGEK